ncbi:MAG: helix-turn-helix domain-containing protein [Myxococcota bacterium]
MSQVEDQVTTALSEHGFTKSEARTYVALLKAHPATGYEIAARAGVPRSAIYAVVKRLAATGAIRAVSSEPKRYSPIAPSQLLQMLNQRFTQRLESLERSFERIRSNVPDASTWTLTGYDAILDRAASMIDDAKSSVHLSLWGREASRLAPTISRAKERGVSAIAFSFTALPPLDARCLSYGLREDDLSPHWDHKLVLVVDQTRGLIGTVDNSEDARAVETDEPAVLDMAINNLVLDVTLFGERMGQDTASVVGELANRFAPIDDLLEQSVPLAAAR